MSVETEGRMREHKETTLRQRFGKLVASAEVLLELVARAEVAMGWRDGNAPERPVPACDEPCVSDVPEMLGSRIDEARGRLAALLDRIG